jgi:hypothetical protein
MEKGGIPLRSAFRAMGRKRPGADPEGMTLFATSEPSKPEPAMQFFHSSQNPWVSSKQPLPPAPLSRPRAAPAPGFKPETRGWFDSSFDLATGLEVTEEDDTLYQLWDLSQD